VGGLRWQIISKQRRTRLHCLLNLSWDNIIFQHPVAFKMSFVATCFGLTKPSSCNYQLEEITALHWLTRQYYHAVTARLRAVTASTARIWEMYTRTSLMLVVCTVFTLCSVCVVFLGQACVPYILSWDVWQTIFVNWRRQKPNTTSLFMKVRVPSYRSPQS
jgi:hypothetical protein